MIHEVLLDIARCPALTECLNGDTDDHPCATVVQAQIEMGIHGRQHQTPEPWSGRIDTAPILFVSSNPSISVKDVYPTADWQDEDLADFFQNRFEGGKREWIEGGNNALALDGTQMRATAFWSAVRRRAEELLRRPAKPGVDYALTEIVHCKSRSEIGVREALGFCDDGYTETIMRLSAARVVVVLGRLASDAIRARFNISDEYARYGPVEWSGRERMIVFLPHPNARDVRSFAKCVPPDKLQKLQKYLASTM